MSFITDFIKEDIKKHPEMAKEYAQEDLNLDAAVIVRQMRDELGMSQQEFANYVHKPQSTIGRIESGSMNVTVGLLNEIAHAAHHKIRLELV